MKGLAKGVRVCLEFMVEQNTETTCKFGVIENIDHDFFGMGVDAISGLMENGYPFSCSSNNVTIADNQNSSLELAKYTRFESWVSDQDEYQSLLSAHGERLFERDFDTGYRIRTIRLAFKAWSALIHEKSLV